MLVDSNLHHHKKKQDKQGSVDLIMDSTLQTMAFNK